MGDLRSCAPTSMPNLLEGLPMMCVGPRQRAARQNAEAPAGPAPAIPTMGLPGGPQARFPAGRPPIPEHQRPPISVTAHRAQSFALHQPGLQHAAVNNPAPPPPPPPPPNFRGNFPPPPSALPMGPAAQLAQAQAEMARAVADGDFERCITLREKVKSLKLAMSSRELD